MFETIDLLGWQLHLDRAATSAVYATLPPGTGCNCTRCRNFVLAVTHLPPPMLHVLHRLAIDPSKPVSVSATSDGARPQHLYFVAYAAVARVLSTSGVNRNVYGRVHVTVDSDIDRRDPVVPSHPFPEPVLQIDWSGHLPWLLPEPPEGPEA